MPVIRYIRRIDGVIQRYHIKKLDKFNNDYVSDRKRHRFSIAKKKIQAFIFEKKPEKIKKKQENIKILISIGDYKHTEFDIIIKRIISNSDYRNLIGRSRNEEEAHERIRRETIKMAASSLRANKHYGLAKMLENNDDIEYVTGGEYTYTNEPEQQATFTRFDIRGDDRLAEIGAARLVPVEYDSKKQRKIE